MTTSHHSVVAFDFATVSDCDQLVVDPIHASGGKCILITDIPDLVLIAVVAPVSNSDQFSLSAVISIAQAMTNQSVSIKVFLKH